MPITNQTRYDLKKGDRIHMSDSGKYAINKELDLLVSKITKTKKGINVHVLNLTYNRTNNFAITDFEINPHTTYTLF